MLKHFLSAFALVLVFEGILPFLSPDTWRQLIRRMLDADSRTLRVIGFMSMLAGVLLLYMVHG